MSIFYRKENYRDLLFKKYLHLKSRTKKVLETLPFEYSFDDFLRAFKSCYPAAWDDIIYYCNRRRNNFSRRKEIGLRTVSYCSPVEYIKRNCNWRRKGHEVLSDEERQIRYNELLKKGRRKKELRATTIIKNIERIQEVTPSYVKDLIKAYFQTRRVDTLNVNARYLILIEAAQFRSKETIQFLNKVACCDKNDELREIAYKSLVRLGEKPWKSKKRNGRRKLSQLKRVDLQKNPTELLQLLYSNQDILYQDYDLFLSHSSLDVRELLELKNILNKQDLTVYIDWVNDPVMLARERQNEDTWGALELRMQQSKILLYVLTDNSLRSSYTEREVNYFKQLSKRIIVYQPHETTLPRPQYLENCEIISIHQLKNIGQLF